MNSQKHLQILIPLSDNEEDEEEKNVPHCHLCRRPFNLDLRRPLGLSCGHTLCKMCLSDISTANKVKCPVCRNSQVFTPRHMMSITLALQDLIH